MGVPIHVPDPLGDLPGYLILNLVHLFVYLHLNDVYHLHGPSLVQHIPDLIGDLPGGLVDQQTPTDWKSQNVWRTYLLTYWPTDRGWC